MSKEGRASYLASKAKAAVTPKSKGGTAPTANYFYNPTTGHYTYRVGGGTPEGDWVPLGSEKPAGYGVGGQPLGVTTETGKKVVTELIQQKELAALKATTTQKEKEVMTLQYGLQQGMFSAKAAEKARAAQQELMKDLPEKEPTKTAIIIGGKTFTGTYGLKRVYSEPTEEKVPAIFRGTPTAKKDEGPFIPAKPKTSKETVDVTYSLLPLSSLLTKNIGVVTEYKAPEEKWSRFMYDIKKKLETKEIAATRAGKEGLADIYGFGSTLLYPIRTPESTGKLAMTFGKGAVIGVGGTILGLTTGPIIPTILAYGGAGYGATQVPKLQEQIAAAQFLGPVAYREKLAETGAQAGAAIGGAYAGSLLVPATITAYKEWHDEWITSKMTYEETAILEGWEKTLAHSKFISLEQKQIVLERTGAQPAFYKQEYFLSTKPEAFDISFPKPGELLQLKQAQIYLPETEIVYKTQVEPVTKFVESQYLGKWLPTPKNVGYYRFQLNQLRMDAIALKGGWKGYGATQYELGTVDVNTFGESFFESSYFKTGIYTQKPTLLLEYKPVGTFESFMQRMTNIEYTPPKVFLGKKASGQIFDFSTFDEEVLNPFSDLTKKSKLGLGGKKTALTKALEKPWLEEPSVYDWEFYPASMAGIFGIGKVEDKSLTKLNLNLFQEQKKEQKQEQKLGQISLLGLKQISLTKQEQKLEQISLTKQGLGQLTGQRQTTGQITEQVTVPELKIPVVTVPELKLTTNLKVEIEPEPELVRAFGFGGFRFPSSGKDSFNIFLLRKRARPKKREITIEPFAGLYDVTVSQFMFGKGTHPARTRKEKEKFKRRIRESSQLFPTVELERKFRKMKL